MNQRLSKPAQAKALHKQDWNHDLVLPFVVITSSLLIPFVALLQLLVARYS